MKRILQRELLDDLPGQDPQAIRSRRDLRRINALMGSARLMAGRLRLIRQQAVPRRIIDLGAGDGAFLRGLVRRLPALPEGLEVVLVDRAMAADVRVLAKLREQKFLPRVEQADAVDWLAAMPAAPGTWVVANLFLHHFSEETLRRLLRLVADRAEVFCACEPRRSRWPLAVSGLVALIGAHAITRHDAVASVRAGFSAAELSPIWPARAGWRLSEGRAGLFSHLFLAQRT